MFVRLAVLLFLVPSSGLSQGVVHVVGGATSDIGFGSSMDGGADFDGDGYPDLVVGAWKSCSGKSVTIVSGRTGIVLRRIAAPTGSGWTDPLFSYDVAAIDDVDLDGFCDLSTGAPKTDVSSPGSGEGAIYVYSGSTGAQINVLNGPSGSNLGTFVARYFDFNNDGRGDLCTEFKPSFGVSQVRAYSPWTGHAQVLLSTNGVLGLENVGDSDGDGNDEIATVGFSSSQPSFWRIPGPSFSFGLPGPIGLVGIAGGMDFDGDGNADYAIGNPIGPSNAGHVGVFSGTTGAALAIVSGSFADQFLGRSLIMLPDVDGDGRADLLIGSGSRHDANGCQNGDNSKHFMWRIVGLGSGGAVKIIAQVDALAGTSAGYEVALIGDVNGDGSPEFAVASPTEGKGIVRIYSMKCGATAPIGAGCAGSGGIVPTVAANGCLTPGGTISLDVSNAVGGSIAYFALGLGPGSAPLGNGCLLNVAPLAPSLLGPFILFPLGGSGPGVGFLNIVAEVPIASPLGSLALQGLVLDPGAPSGYCVTGGVSLLID